MGTPTGKLPLQPWMTAPETVRIMTVLNAGDHAARFVGGCVRNALANRPVVDIDIATPLTPDAVTALLQENNMKVIPTGLKHGTVTAVVDGKVFEITTLRKDVFGYGRHADVLFTDDWRTDATRRDFTINAMYADLDGHVYDYFGGIEDLRQGRVIFVGNPEQRIREDILRIFRFFRFYAQFGRGAPHPPAYAACTALSHLVPKLSVERIRQEIFKLLETRQCATVWELMRKSGAVTHVLPEATDVKSLTQLLKLEYIYESESDALRRLLCLLDVSGDGLVRVIKSLKLSNREGVALYRMFEGMHHVKTDLSPADIRRWVYKIGNDYTRSALMLYAAKGGGEGDMVTLYDVATSFRPPRFPLIGADVLALGHPEGEAIGRILAAMEAWWVAADFTPGRTACLEKLAADFTPPQNARA